MPYRDPERKRQWEQEHREQRNARRRTPRVAVSSIGHRFETPMTGSITDEGADFSANLIPVLAIRFTVLVILLVAGWRFFGILEPGGHS